MPFEKYIRPPNFFAAHVSRKPCVTIDGRTKLMHLNVATMRQWFVGIEYITLHWNEQARCVGIRHANADEEGAMKLRRHAKYDNAAVSVAHFLLWIGYEGGKRKFDAEYSAIHDMVLVRLDAAREGRDG